MTKAYAFTYHLNRPAWKKTGRVQWTIHYRGVCNIVDTVVCRVATRTHVRNSQPVAVVKGNGCLRIQDGVGYLMTPTEYQKQ